MSYYSNPVATAGDFADPFVLRHNGRYYLYATNPDLRCWSSDDLVTWSLEGATIADDTFPEMVPFAPEVVYDNGYFYLYTSPSGTGHRVLRATSPTGPFQTISANIGCDIDGNVLIDDDGRWYFYWAGENSILACEMYSPTDLGPVVDTGVTMHGWTEGPFVMKRDGWYHMTLTGNHYLSPGYRINAAASRHPLEGWRDGPLNPILLSAEAPVVGLGHSSTVLGPDLVSHHLVYHNLNKDHSRDLNIDRQVWNGQALQVLGPSRLAPTPRPADAAGTPGDGWETARGTLTASGTFSELAGPGAVTIWTAVPVGEEFTSEHNLRRPGESAGGYGVLLEGFERDLRVRLDPGRRVVEVLGAGTGTLTSRLPAGFDHTALHCCRLELDAGVLTVSLDGRRLVEAQWTGAPTAHLGYFTESSALELGHTAVTHDVERLRSRAAVKPVPGRFWAALTSWPGQRVDAPGPVPWERLVVRPGERVDYDLLIAEQGEYGIFLTGDFAHGTEVAVTIGDVTTVLAATSDTAVRTWRGALPAGPVTMGVGVRTGEATLDLITIVEVDPGSTTLAVEGSVVGAGKKVLAGADWHDYTVDAMLDVQVTATGGHGDLLLRATHLADGFEGNDPVLGTDFLLGYSVQLHPDAVVLARHDYDTTVISRKDAALNLGVPHRVRATVRGSLLTVLVDDHIALELQDQHPHLVGGAGIRSLGASVAARMIVTPQ